MHYLQVCFYFVNIYIYSYASLHIFKFSVDIYRNVLRRKTVQIVSDLHLTADGLC